MKFKYLTLFLVILIFLISACATQPAQTVCNKPYILVGNDCCLDKDANGICDKDEETELISNQPIDKEELAEKTASKFARVWEHRQWDVMYPMFISSLKKFKTKDEFVKIMDFKETESNIVVRLDDIEIENDNIAYAYYSVSSTLVETKAPSMKLKWEDNDWKVDAFATYFTVNELPLSECTDLNKCTTDMYSFIEKKCIHKEFFPCCGNNLCESGERTYPHICNFDCFSEKFIFEKREHKTISLLGSDYDIIINDIEEKREFRASFGRYVYIKNINITINDLTTIMNDGDELKIKDNVYLRYDIRYTMSYSIESTTLVLFNRDES